MPANSLLIGVLMLWTLGLLFLSMSIVALISARRKHVEEVVLGKIDRAAYNTLTTLDLSHRDLKQLPASIGKLQNLRFLDLSGNRLKRLPPEIGKLTELEYLDLSNNNLKDLPRQINQLRNLEYLNVSYNRLTSLSFFDPNKLVNIQEFSAFGNNIEAFPHEMSALMNAGILNIDVKIKNYSGFTRRGSFRR